jgi:hypothetical protein
MLIILFSYKHFTTDQITLNSRLDKAESQYLPEKNFFYF